MTEIQNPAETNRPQSWGEPLAIGVDGGGSKTVAWLGRFGKGAPQGQEEPLVLGVGESGASNQRAVGFESACRQILLAIEKAFSQAGLQPEPVSRACFCLAGAGREAEQTRMVRWAKEIGIAREVQVIHDGEALLAATVTPSGKATGIALISGTGSFAWGRTQQGHTARCGGWGHLIDDSGSGFAIGSDCLTAIARQADRRGPTTKLTAAVLDRYRLQQPVQLIDLIYSAEDRSRQIAALAPLVFEASESDPLASGIIQVASDALATAVLSVWGQLCERDPIAKTQEIDLSVGGSVLKNQHAFRAAVSERIRCGGAILREVTVVSHPVRGALNLALDR